jgi:hypothetical protein
MLGKDENSNPDRERMRHYEFTVATVLGCAVAWRLLPTPTAGV